MMVSSKLIFWFALIAVLFATASAGVMVPTEQEAEPGLSDPGAAAYAKTLLNSDQPHPPKQYHLPRKHGYH